MVGKSMSNPASNEKHRKKSNEKGKLNVFVMIK